MSTGTASVLSSDIRHTQSATLAPTPGSSQRAKKQRNVTDYWHIHGSFSSHVINRVYLWYLFGVSTFQLTGLTWDFTIIQSQIPSQILFFTLDQPIKELDLRRKSELERWAHVFRKEPSVFAENFSSCTHHLWFWKQWKTEKRVVWLSWWTYRKRMKLGIRWRAGNIYLHIFAMYLIAVKQ